MTITVGLIVAVGIGLTLGNFFYQWVKMIATRIARPMSIILVRCDWRSAVERSYYQWWALIVLMVLASMK